MAERTVVLLRGAGIDIEIVPGLSFADLAWNRLGIDPMTGARVVDARTFAVDSAGFAGPMLLAQCDTRFVLSDVKLALLEVLPPEHEVIVLQGLGLPDEQLVTGRARRARPGRSSPITSRRCSSTPATSRSRASSRACSR